jgi:hypothetical protein
MDGSCECFFDVRILKVCWLAIMLIFPTTSDHYRIIMVQLDNYLARGFFGGYVKFESSLHPDCKVSWTVLLSSPQA